MPLVLVQNPVIVNEGYEWKDIEGEQYHFPNQYKNRCAKGTPFVYYRGTRRPDGRRAAPEYFGHGHIGDNRGFYFRAFDGLITRTAAGYYCGGNWASSTGGIYTH